MKISKLLVGLIKYMFVITLVVISVVPIVWVLMSSFKTNAQILESAFKLPETLNWSNYFNAFKIAPLTTFYINSIFVAVFGTGMNLIIIGMAAYVFARFEFKAKSILMLVFSISLLIPNTSVLYPLYVTMNKLGLYDKLQGLILVYIGFGLPVTLYILKSYFLTIPKEIEESAKLDGAGFLRTFIQIILPIAKPGFGTAGVMQFLLCWNEFQFALILTSGNNSRTLPVALSYFNTQFASNYGAMFAATVIIVIPSIIIYAILQEQVVSGLAAGAVKG
ncbi:carbohydrate ABC transporter membrane protein 2 (CUT1 family) [Ruminiclostridium sufflavum DSM 19573]|uniref:Carbohydrate ABC transporter membrane protein 2 (CUT1 family) n=1 Tax=Ruminiclostridium sufflavum DSM 19573 TaxID=1121337 RepID=A0A318XQ42_9FIRM|nr:carbohydrate ABC transporter permease [Ruminiclostridium sufflavum]PYG88245.1 carbohydrate ABC transporter membrane protein 2 (CUT1 family) [Ruminiclostridium sufflavum DSM 19573]